MARSSADARADVARSRVRGAYERARLGAALLAAWPAPILLAVAVWLHGHASAFTYVAAAGVATLFVLAAWRGGSWRRGAFAGALAGLAPLVVPAVMLSMRGGACASCTPSSMNVLACTLICLTTGILSGVAVGLRAARDPAPRRFALAALAVAAAVGSLSCGATGLGGAAGVVVGLAAGGIPTLAFARRPA
jgi:hypothetical protein